MEGGVKTRRKTAEREPWTPHTLTRLLRDATRRITRGISPSQFPTRWYMGSGVTDLWTSSGQTASRPFPLYLRFSTRDGHLVNAISLTDWMLWYAIKFAN